MVCRGAVRARETDESPLTLQGQALWSWIGSIVLLRFEAKQFARPDPAESARSATPLPRIVFDRTTFPLGRQGR
jgi:hypothetical protein